ncbi:DUF1311 domain-containing protein [Rhizobiaceae bacterium BDR2-2]|uniref:DUF1311 domain-containing protein n=1 Tax=Ectorhizobium quercum TaxID=2965071 RepID=A0AAE3SV74_9HYPH|nr:lysozyme inhibitor LprI family protein [Ectorhizobium quercum]MCX8996040.1 DUF1311 domain-containing protein [Ectorhizobium quercum]
MAAPLLGAGLAVTPLWAQDAGIPLSTCLHEAQGVTVEMLDCLDAEHVRLDDILNQVWSEAMSELEDDMADALQSSQRDWLAYRDSTCNTEAAFQGGGSFSGVAVLDCRVRLVGERIDWLKGLLDLPSSTSRTVQ